MSDLKKRMQVAAQCRAIVHLATNIALVHSDKAEGFAAGYHDRIIDLVGRDTARLMEVLGDVLNGMDAATEQDAWMDGIFEGARQYWPTDNSCSHCGGAPVAREER